MKYSTPVINITKFEIEEVLVASDLVSPSTTINDDLPQEEFWLIYLLSTQVYLECFFI